MGRYCRYDEIIVDLGSHKTTDNLLKTKAFTVSVADVEHLVACDYVGIVSANQEPDKMEKAGFTTTKSEFVNAPVINELPLVLECQLIKVIDDSKYLGKIKNVSIDESVLGEDGELDSTNLFRLHTILFITVITVWAKRSAMLFQTVQSLNTDFY